MLILSLPFIALIFSTVIFIVLAIKSDYLKFIFYFPPAYCLFLVASRIGTIKFIGCCKVNAVFESVPENGSIQQVMLCNSPSKDNAACLVSILHQVCYNIMVFNDINRKIPVSAPDESAHVSYCAVCYAWAENRYAIFSRPVQE